MFNTSTSNVSTNGFTDHHTNGQSDQCITADTVTYQDADHGKSDARADPVTHVDPDGTPDPRTDDAFTHEDADDGNPYPPPNVAHGLTDI
jgi:hypothetical protein